MNTITKTFDELELGDTIIVPGQPGRTSHGEYEYTVEIKHEDETVKVKELGGVVVKMDKYKVKI